MIQTVVTAAILYIATAFDLLVILLIFLLEQRLKRIQRYLYWSIFRVYYFNISQFVLAFVLNYVPEKWILGLLGLIPIYLGIKVAIYGDCEGEKRAKKN